MHDTAAALVRKTPFQHRIWYLLREFDLSFSSSHPEDGGCADKITENVLTKIPMRISEVPHAVETRIHAVPSIQKNRYRVRPRHPVHSDRNEHVYGEIQPCR